MIPGKLYIISAPSGAGKTSLVRRLLAETASLAVSVSHTTRARRAAEQDGADYHFVAVETFKSMIAAGEFLEHAQVYDNYYGTARQSVTDSLARGVDVVLEIDWQGAQQVRRMLPAAISIFILPPSIAILRERLQNRGQDNAETIARRMQDAVAEMSHYREFDYLVVNDDFATALMQLKSIIIANRLSQERQREQLHGLLRDLFN